MTSRSFLAISCLYPQNRWSFYKRFWATWRFSAPQPGHPRIPKVGHKLCFVWFLSSLAFLSSPLGLAINSALGSRPSSLTFSTCQSLFHFLPALLVSFFLGVWSILIVIGRGLSRFYSQQLADAKNLLTIAMTLGRGVSQSVTRSGGEMSVNLSLAASLSVEYPVKRFFFFFANHPWWSCQLRR